MSDIQRKPKHRIFAAEFVPLTRSKMGNMTEMRNKLSAWLKRRGLARDFQGRSK